MQIDEWLPRYDFSATYETVVARGQEATWAAIETADMARPLLVRSLMLLRGLPALVARRSRGPGKREARKTASMRPVLGINFTILADVPPSELVLGLEGQFWRLQGGLRQTRPADFRLPVPADVARAVWGFALSPVAGGTRLRTETRIACGDPRTRRRFARYWTVVGPFSGLIRRAILAEIRREAHRRPA